MAFFQEFRPAREPFIKAPASVLVLIGILIFAHVARVLAPAHISDDLINSYGLVAAVYSPKALHALGAAPPDLYMLIAPVFGHMFLHANATHLIFNCLWLLVFGTVVARRFGALGFYLFFLVCGVGGAAVFVALEWGQLTGAIGASGAISGLMGASVRMLNLRQPGLYGAQLPLQSLLSNQVAWFSAVWLVVNLVTGLAGFVPGVGIEPIAWQEHLGGYLVGLLLAGPFDLLFGPDFRRRAA